MKDFIFGTFFGGLIVVAVYLGWLHFEFELFGIIINSTELESNNLSRCREELKRANQRAFDADRLAEQMRNRVLEQQHNQQQNTNLKDLSTTQH